MLKYLYLLILSTALTIGANIQTIKDDKSFVFGVLVGFGAPVFMYSFCKLSKFITNVECKGTSDES